MRQNLNLITLGVDDFARSVAFYERLGWKLTSAPDDDIAFFQAGVVVLALYPRELLAKDAATESAGEGIPRFTLAHCTKSEREVDEVVETAKDAGAHLVKPPQKTFWGGYGAYFRDLDGFLWEVAHNPAWTIDDEGNVDLTKP